MASKHIPAKRQYLEEAASIMPIDLLRGDGEGMYQAWMRYGDEEEPTTELAALLERTITRQFVKLARGDDFVGFMCSIEEAIRRKIPITPEQWDGLKDGSLMVVRVRQS